MRNYQYLDKFFDKIESEIGHTLENSVHDDISKEAIKILFKNFKFEHSKRTNLCVLDIGCGTGRDVKEFRNNNCLCWGVTLNKSEIDVNDKFIHYVDQNFMDEDFTNGFDIVWASHVLEHSPIPLFTLMEYYRVLHDKGVLYIEVPSPKPWSEHNQNHYSIMSKNMWKELFTKANFKLVLETSATMDTDTEQFKDEFWMFYLQKNL